MITREQIEKTTAEWAAENPVLSADAIGIEVTTSGYNRFKRGDGVTAWGDLPYLDNIPPSPDIDMGSAIGILPVIHGGTGADNKNTAARNLMEWGAWTPKVGFLNGATANVTYTKQYGTYVKIGNMVTIAWDMTFTASGSWISKADYIHVVDLPYVPEMDRWCGVVGQLIIPGITYNSSGYACHARTSINGVAHRTLSGAAVSVSSSNTGTFYLAGTMTYKVS